MASLRIAPNLPPDNALELCFLEDERLLTDHAKVWTPLLVGNLMQDILHRMHAHLSHQFRPKHRPTVAAQRCECTKGFRQHGQVFRCPAVS